MEKTSITQAERFANVMADSLKQGLPIALGTARGFLDEHAVEITADVVRFRDGSEIARAERLARRGADEESAGDAPLT